MLDITVTGQALVQTPISVGPATATVRKFLAASHLGFTNLEVAGEAPGAWPTKTRTVHATSAAAVASLKALGFNAVGHANNHSFDLGPPGIAAAKTFATAAGLAFAGSGVSAEEAGKPAIVETEGGKVAVIAADLGPQPEIVYAGTDRAGINPLRVKRIVTVPYDMVETLSSLLEELGDAALQKSRAAVGFRGGLPQDGIEVFGTTVVAGEGISSTFTVDEADLAALGKRIAEARSRADGVLVCLHSHHWKADWGDMPAWFMDLGRGLIDFGADLVVGHGVPVLQPVVFHKGKPIFGSLGNVIFHTERAATYDRERPEVWEGAFCRCRFAGGVCETIDVLPVAVGRPEPGADGLPPAPHALTGSDAERIFERLAKNLAGAERGKLRLAG
jgi:poly-gamma-glutamate synthesis protein (capsule biosynthesis protein)